MRVFFSNFANIFIVKGFVYYFYRGINYISSQLYFNTRMTVTNVKKKFQAFFSRNLLFLVGI